MKTTTMLLFQAFLILIFTGCKAPDEGVVKSSDGVEISYTTHGEGAHTLVLAHGWSCDQTYWKNQVPELSKYFRVVTLDYAGHGKSGMDRSNHTIGSYGDDVIAVINALKLENVILVGHSMGGLVIIDVAEKIPGKVEALIGVDTYQQLVDTLTTKEMMAQFMETLKSDFVANTRAFVRTMFPPGADSLLVETIAADMASAPQDVAMEIFLNMVDYNNLEAWKVLQKIRVPVRAINCDLWPTYTEENRKTVEDFDVKIMPGYGHFVMLENPDLFNRLLKETVDEIEQARQ